MERKRELEYLTADKVRALLEAPYQTAIRDRIILRILASTGCRVSELIGIRWADVNLLPGQEGIRFFGKGGKVREVPLDDPTLISLLDRYRPEGVGLDEPLFELTRQSVTQLVKRYAARAGIQETVYAHILRHSYAVQRLKAGLDLRSLQKLLGHARISTTERYLQLTNVDIRSQMKEARLEW